MFYYFKKPVKPEKSSDDELINDKFYRLQPFWISTFLVKTIIGIPTLFIFMGCVFVPFFGYALGESLGGIVKVFIPFFGAGVLLAVIGIFILWWVTRPWREEDYVSEVIYNAQFYGFYDKDYISNLGNSIRHGITYKCTYLCLTEDFIMGSIYRPNRTVTFFPGTNSSFHPIAIPRGCVKEVYFNFSAHKAGRTYHYDSGIEIKTDEDKVIVIPYGTKESVNRSLKAFRRAGYDAR